MDVIYIYFIYEIQSEILSGHYSFVIDKKRQYFYNNGHGYQ